MNIVQDYITPGMRHRPMTNPRSSLYKKKMAAEYITIHEAWSTANAHSLHNYVKGQRAADRPASWHFSVDEKNIYQALPLDESGWHAGDNLGPGNTNTIGIEICDYAMRRSPQNRPLFWQAVENTARLCAHLIETVPSLKPYPECLRLRQHWHWSGKNCPALIRGGGDWEEFVRMVGRHLKKVEIIEPTPGGDFWLTAGSFTQVENALDKQKELRSYGWGSELRTVEVDGRTFYRVVIDYFHSWAEANKVAAAVPVLTVIIDTTPPPVEDDPDVDRGWIDDNQEKFEDGKDPYQDKLPSGLMELLRQLYNLLKGLFE